MKIRTTCTCPLEIVHDIMKGKWKTIIVFQLRNGGMGLGGQGVCPLSTARGAPVPRLFRAFVFRVKFQFKYES